MDDVEKFEVDGLTVRILYDEDGPNPRKEFDHAAHMVCFHRNYMLGDKHNMSVDEARDYVDMITKDGAVVLPLYLYDHSGITMSVSKFSCPWDSGQVGFIYMTREDIRKNWGVKRVTKKLLEQAKDLMVSEVKEYDYYLTGQVYGFIVEAPASEDEDEGKQLDSCWGFIGDLEYVRGEATQAAKHEAKAYFAKKREEAMKYGAEHNV